jgi:uncharacterized protein YybS (DUF2232 family)
MGLKLAEQGRGGMVQIPRWQPVVWSVAYFLLLMTLVTPFSILTVSFLLIPPLILYMIRGPRWFWIYLAIPLAAMLLLLQGWGLPVAVISLFFLPPALLMGEMYRRQQPARIAVFSGAAAIIAELVIALAAAYALDVQFIRDVERALWENYYALPDMMRTDATEEAMSRTIEYAVRMIPLLMIVTAMFYVTVTHALGGRMLRMMGVSVPSFPRIRDWMLPKSLIWYYLVAMLLDLFVRKDVDSLLTMILINGIPLLMIAFCAQAVSFLAFVSHHKGWGILLPLVGVVFSLFLPNVVSLVGVLDAAFPLRQGIQKR